MSKMKDYKFEHLYEISSGLSSTKDQAGHGAPFLSFSSVFNNFFLPDTLSDKMDTSAEEQERYSIKEGDIFLTRTSETLDELAMSSVAVKDYPHATYSGFLKRLRPTQTDITYAKFMAFYLRSSYFRKIIDNNATMTLRASFNEDIFSWLHLMLPDYNEQKKIGDWLYVLDSKIKNNQRVIATLESMAKTLYDYWFVQFDFPNDNGHPYKTSGGKMEWNETLSREIPVGWEVQKIGSLIKKQKSIKSIERKNYSSNGKYPIVDQSIEYIAGYTNDEVNALGDEDSIIIFGDHTRILKYVDFPFVIGADGTQRIVSKNKERMPQVLFYYSLARIDLSNYGYARHYKFLKDSMIVVPPKDVARHFEMQVKFWRHIISKKIRENRYLEELRDFILPMLMNGQVTFRQ